MYVECLSSGLDVMGLEAVALVLVEAINGDTDMGGVHCKPDV